MDVPRAEIPFTIIMSAVFPDGPLQRTVPCRRICLLHTRCAYAHGISAYLWSTPWTLTGKRFMYGYMDEHPRGKYENMLDTLTRPPARMQQGCYWTIAHRRARFALCRDH